MRLLSPFLLLHAAAVVVVVFPAHQKVTGLATTSHSSNRREVLQQGALSVMGVSTAFHLIQPYPSAAGAVSDNPTEGSILVLGASGKTGRECVQYILQTGRPCIATTRTGTWTDLVENSVGDAGQSTRATSTNLLTIATADVTDPSSLNAAIGGLASTTKSGLAGVIYAASASKQGGTAAAVDRDGVVAAARACIAANVPRFVVVSSGAVTQPDSLIYKLLNSFGNIMEAKIDGENEVRRLYADPSVLRRNLGYTIVRPGGLTVEPAVGAASLELNQGDAILGRLPRADVAVLCVESCFSPNAFDTTFECYEAVTAKPVGVVGFSNLCTLYFAK